MEYFEKWNALTARLDEGDLTALTQLVAFKIFASFDACQFPESLTISDRELMSRCQIQSTSTIVDARRRLKNAGIIDFTTKKGKPTIYRLTIESNSNRTATEQQSNTCRTAEEIPNTRARATLNPYLTTPTPPPAQEVAANLSGLDAAKAYWRIEKKGAPLDDKATDQLALWLLQRGRGLEWIKAMMDLSAKVNRNPRGLSFATLLRTIDIELKKAKPKKSPAKSVQKSAQVEGYNLRGVEKMPGW